MYEADSTKCSHYNSGYCKFIRSENGCRYLHPAETCTLQKCRDKGCPSRHPKMCRHGEQCRYKTKCMYKHKKYDSSNIRPNTKKTDDRIESLEKEITLLKAEISKLKAENEFKVEALGKVHLLEMEEVKKKNNDLVKRFKKEVRELKIANTKLQLSLESKESVNVTLVCKDNVTVKQNDQVKDDNTNLEQEQKDISKKSNERDNDHIMDHNNTHIGKDNLKCQHCSTKFSDLLVMKKHIEICRTYFEL